MQFEFQCSSASRKFLNVATFYYILSVCIVSVLFSEPKIPQCWRRGCTASAGRRFSALQRAENSSMRRAFNPSADIGDVSVLFSEPKIPQFTDTPRTRSTNRTFQCSSASRKFLNCCTSTEALQRASVSVLFSEPKIPQWRLTTGRNAALSVSVLFSEPKIPQC